MRKIGVFVVVLAIIVSAHAPIAAAARERGRDQNIPLNDPRSLASPDYEGYRPAWANPYAEPDEIGVNDDPTPFYPSDVDSGPNPLDPDGF
jgi:hypothetical protein